MAILQIGERYSSENALQQLEGRKFSVSSGSQLSSSQNLLKQKHHSDKTSPSNITSDCYSDRNCQFSPSGSFAQRNLMGNIYVKEISQDICMSICYERVCLPFGLIIRLDV